MRWLRAKGANWAAWLGVLALALNSLVPIHLAFDLVAALAPAPHEHAEPRDLSRSLIAFIAWHHEAGDDDDGDHHGGQHHHDAACPVCSALGSLAALALPIVASVSMPAAIVAPITSWPAATAAATIVTAFYRSRAPPFVLST